MPHFVNVIGKLGTNVQWQIVFKILYIAYASNLNVSLIDKTLYVVFLS